MEQDNQAICGVFSVNGFLQLGRDWPNDGLC